MPIQRRAKKRSEEGSDYGGTATEVGVPSSRIWNPIIAFKNRTHIVAVMRPTWIAENHYTISIRRQDGQTDPDNGKVG